MKKLTKKTLMAVFAFVLAVVALGTTTFAWFTLGQTVKVDGFDVNVQGGEGLEMAYISHDGDTNRSGWVSYISGDDMLGYLSTEYSAPTNFTTDFQFKAVTSTDGKIFKPFVYDGSAAPSLGVDIAATTQKTLDDGILEFKLKFRTQASGTAQLTWNSVTLAEARDAGDLGWEAGVAYTHNKANAGESGNGSIAAGESLNYYTDAGARISVTSGDTTKVFEKPDGDYNTVLGNGTTTPAALAFNKGAHNYFENATGHDNLPTLFSSITNTVETVTSINGTQFAVDFPAAGSPGDYRELVVTVRVYLEGFDPDTFNCILSGKLKIALGFKLVTP
ncbi:MAG: hypothetical protein ACOX5X_01425 [Acholeplasmataceae bacterium]|jgi:hypothetical protein